MSLGLFSAAWSGQAKAEAVDTELVLLVDVTSSALNNNEFSQLMNGYATAFTSLTLTSSLGQSIQTSADSSITVVPEPGRMLALVNSAGFAKPGLKPSGKQYLVSTETVDVERAMGD